MTHLLCELGKIPFPSVALAKSYKIILKQELVKFFCKGKSKSLNLQTWSLLQLLCPTKAVLNNVNMGNGCVPIKFYLQKLVMGKNWPTGCCLMTPGIKCQPELIYPNMSQRYKISRMELLKQECCSMNCISMRVLSSGSGKGARRLETGLRVE